MESVRCVCRECRNTIGHFSNVWTQIGKSYFSPVVDPPDDLDITPHGAVRLGENGTLVEACQLQDVACGGCNSILGIKCLEAPTNHVLHENQVLLRATSMASFGSETGDEVALVVKRSLTLREPPAASNGRGSAVNGSQSRRPPAMPGDYPAVDAVELLRLRADLEAQKGDIERIDSAGFRMVAAINESVSRLESDMAKMRHALTEAQRETRGNQDDLASLKSDLKDVRLLAQDRTAVAELADQMRAAQAAMGEVRKSVDGTVSRMRDDLVDMKSRLHRHTESLDDLRSLVSDCISARDHNEKDVAAIRAELAQLRKQMDEGRTKQSESFPSRELDILTSSIAKIGNRASQVESLQMEFAILKGRVERIENAARRGRATASQEDDTIVAVASSPYDLYPFDDEDGYRVDNKPVAARRKRPSSGLDAAGTAGSSSAAKRAAFTSDFRDDPDGAAEWPPDETKGPPQRSVKAKGSSARATKNVRIDRRSKRS